MGRRIVRVPVHLEVLMHMMTEGRTFLPQICYEGLPEDVQFAGSSFDQQGLVANIFFIHDSFDEIPAGQPVPEWTPKFNAHRPANWDEIDALLRGLPVLEGAEGPVTRTFED